NGVSKAFLDAAAKVAADRPPRTEGTARFISPARFDPAYKGQHLLLKAFGGAEWRARDWHLSLVGGGSHTDLMRRLIGYYGVPGERVTVASHTSDILGAFSGADVIVMPSRRWPAAGTTARAGRRPAARHATWPRARTILSPRTGCCWSTYCPTRA